MRQETRNTPFTKGERIQLVWQCLIRMTFPIAKGIVLLVLPLQLLAVPALPVLVPEGENLADFPDWMINKNSAYYSVAFSPNGKLLASSTSEGIQLWGLHSRRLLHLFGSGSSYSLDFSPDGKTLASGSADRVIRLWDIQSKKLINTLHGHSESVKSVSFSPSGKILASGSRDKTVKLWNTQTGDLIHTFSGHSKSVESVDFNLDGKLLISGSNDNAIKLWDTQEKSLLHTYEGHTSWVNSVSFSPDGQTFVSGSSDKTVKLWSTHDKVLQHTLGGNEGVYAANFSPDGRILAAGDFRGKIKFWDVQTKHELDTLKNHQSIVSSINFSPDGKTLASGSYDKTLRLWDIQTGHQLHAFQGHTSEIYSISFSPDGKTFATGSGDHTLKLWDAQTKKMIYAFDGHGSLITTIDFSPDSKTLASGSWDNTIKLWDVQGKHLLHTFDDSNINSVNFNSDGKILLSTGSNKTIKLWDVETKRLLHTSKEHASSFSSVSFSPNDKIFASGSYDGSIRIWDTQTKRLIHTFSSEGSSGQVYSLSFGPKGKLLASASQDKTIKLWDLNDKSLLHTFEGHTNMVYSAQFSPNGELLASGSRDGTLKLWDVATKQLLTYFKVRHGSAVRSVSFSPNGKTFISSSEDGTTKLWDIQNGRLLHTFFGGVDGNWLSHDGKRFQRGDAGNFLLNKNGQNLLQAPPKGVLGRPEIHYAHQEPLDINLGEGKKLTLEVKNTSSQLLYWPTVQLAEGDTFSLYNITAPHSIKPGETQTVQFEVSPHLGKVIEPRKDSLRFRIVAPGQASSDWRGAMVNVHTPKLILRETSLLSDLHLIRVRIENSGTQTVRNLLLDLKISGLLEQQIPILSIPHGIEAGGFLEHTFSIPKSYVLADNLQTSLDVRTGNLPFMIWKFGSPNPDSLQPKSFWWLYGTLAFLFILSTFGVFYLRRYRHPLLLSLSKQPQKLLELPIEQLPEAQQRLKQTRRLDTILSDVSVSELTLQKALDFQQWDNDEKAVYLASVLGTTLDRNKGLSLKTPSRFPLNIDKLQLCIPNKIAPEDLLRELKANLLTSNNITLIIGPDSTYQRKLYKTTRDLSNKWVAPQGKELTQLLLSPDPENILAEILAGQLSLQQISPYKTGGGVHNESTFFGRRELISQITNRDPANYVVVGGRQLGKSTLLQALKRRYADNPQVECYYIPLSNEVLIPRLSGELKLERTNDPEIFAEQLEACIQENNRRYIFLIDEADRFIEHEKEQNYPILNVLRRLSEKGNCAFMLAGFWQLYQHTALDYQSPIRNFGESLSVAALEKPACIELATEPMRSMNLLWDNETIVEQLVDKCGQRANLIAIACQHIVRNLPPQQRTITAGDMHKALYSDEMRRALTGWVVGITEEEQTYDRLVVYATIECEGFTTADLLEMAKQKKLQLDTKQLDKTLSRLELAFILGREKGRWLYRVPLFVEYIKEDAPAAKLEAELQGLESKS